MDNKALRQSDLKNTSRPQQRTKGTLFPGRCVCRLHATWGVTVYRIMLPFARGVGLEYDLVLLGLHCFLRLAHALYCHSG